MQEFNFELFTGHKGKYNVVVSISKPGILSLSSGFFHKYKLSEYKGVQLFFDKKANSIAIKFSREEVTNMFNLKPREDNKGGFIACKSYISAYGLEKYFGKRFSPSEIEHPELGKIFVLDLNEEKK